MCSAPFVRYKVAGIGGLAFPLMGCQLDPALLPGFGGNILATLIGAFVGFGLALLLDRMVQRSRRKSEESSQLRNAAWSVEENLELVRQVLEYVRPEDPFLPILAFRMNTHLLDQAVLRLSELCDDRNLLWELEHFRFQLEHFNGKLDIMQQYGVRTFRVPSQNEVTGLRAAVVEHGELITVAGDRLVPLLDKRLTTLKAPKRLAARPPLEVKAGEAKITG